MTSGQPNVAVLLGDLLVLLNSLWSVARRTAELPVLPVYYAFNNCDLHQ
jgi:hypothetical protein